MKNFGCIVPVSFIIAIGLLLAGCATQFGTFTDKSTPQQYLDKHHPFHAKARKPSHATVVEAPEAVPYWKCNGTAATNDPRCPVTTDPQAVSEKPKKKGFWSHFPHWPFKKKDQ